MSIRRLPVYLVLDCSGSMAGEPIEAVRQGVKALLSDLRSDPMCLENTCLSVITFAGSARQDSPLTDLVLFQEPTLTAGGSTAMGHALELLTNCIQSEVVKGDHHTKGDYKPLVFLMTDGQPTDTWEVHADNLKKTRPGNIIACAAGPGADTSVLQRITENVVQLTTLQPEQLRNFFKWVSRSIKVSSVQVNQGGQGTTAISLPPPPSGVNIVI